MNAVSKNQPASPIDIWSWAESIIHGLTPRDNGWADGHCPFPNHPDKNPSFSINVDSMTFLCRGCGEKGTLNKLAERLGRTPPPNNTIHESTVVYQYRDEKGNLNREVVRKGHGADKKIWQRKSSTENNVKGVPPLPYRLPELLQAFSEKKPVFIVEGEKDVESLVRLGYTATTNSGGAGKWGEHHSKWFPSGTEVFLCGDADQPGVKHVESIARSLHQRGCMVRIIRLPYEITENHGRDISDWIAEGNIREEFEILVRQAVRYEPEQKVLSAVTAKRKAPTVMTAPELQAKTFPEIHWAVPGIIGSGLTILAGSTKTGKSWLALQLAVALSVGGYMFGTIKVPKCECLYLALEDSGRRLQNRLNTMNAHPSELLLLHTEWSRGEQAREDLNLYMEEHPETKVVIIDTLAKIRGNPESRRNSYFLDYEEIGKLKSFADKFDLVLICITHKKKGIENDILNTITGSTGITGAADTLIVLNRNRNSNNATMHITGRDIEEQNLEMKFDSDICTWTIQGEAVQRQRTPERQAIVDLLHEQRRPMSPREINDHLGKDGDSIRQLLGKLEKAGVVERKEYGKYTIPSHTTTTNHNKPTLHTDNTGHTDNSPDIQKAETMRSVTTVTGVTENIENKILDTDSGGGFFLDNL